MARLAIQGSYKKIKLALPLTHISSQATLHEGSLDDHGQLRWSAGKMSLPAFGFAGPKGAPSPCGR